MGEFCPTFSGVKSGIWFLNFSCWQKLWKKTLPSSIFTSNSTFCTTLWNQKEESFWTYISYQKSSRTEFFLQSASLKLLGILWIHCCHVSIVLKKPHWTRWFLVTFFGCCWEFMYRYFNMFVNFGIIFFPETMVSCFWFMASIELTVDIRGKCFILDLIRS